MKAALLVFLGGGTGSLVRYGLGKWLNHAPAMPWGTWLANFLACLIVGLALGWTASKGSLNDQTKLLILTGFCGGFSTFSTFSGETIDMMQSGRMGMAALYAIGSLATCLAATWLGFWLAKQ